jgi:hypothetical protein
MIKSYSLGGQSITVRQVDKIQDVKNKCFLTGLFYPNKGKIEIAKNNPDLNKDVDVGDVFMRKSHRNEAICHEIIHSWLSNMSEYDLDSNEPFVQKLGMALHQFLKSSVWERDVRIDDGKLNIK